MEYQTSPVFQIPNVKAFLGLYTTMNKQTLMTGDIGTSLETCESRLLVMLLVLGSKLIGRTILIRRIVPVTSKVPPPGHLVESKLIESSLVASVLGVRSGRISSGVEVIGRLGERGKVVDK